MISNTNLVSGPFVTNGATTNFPVIFTFLSNTDIVVYLINSTTGVFTKLVYITDYAVTGATLQNGGTITTTIAQPAGNTILILRNMAYVQNVDIENQETFYPDVVESEFDFLTLLCQQLAYLVSLCYAVPPGQQPPLNIPSGIPLSPAILQFLHPTLPQPSGIFPVADGFQLVINGVGIMHWNQNGTDTNPTVLPVVT